MEPAQNGDGPLTAPAANTKSDLDKFKRRLIRAVARLVINEKKPEDEVWTQLKEETKCDCKQVWHRMKCLTIKKLKRLLAADDVTDKIPAVARMSISDWLMFDLVLVHEKIDVIEMEKLKTADMKPMCALLKLVNDHRIEDFSGSDLAEAWSKATSSYNADGRQCSPMLMQLRWYQLKELTRNTFYSFWSIYRGNPKNLDAAQLQHRPSKLMMAVAKRYPDLVVTNFMDWEERVEKRLVILPEEFDEKIRAKGVAPDNSPDIVVMEPVIETIGVDSDSEEKETEHDDQLIKTNDEQKFPDRSKPEPIDLEEEEKFEAEEAESHDVDDGSNESTEVAPPDLHALSPPSMINDDEDSKQQLDLTRDDERSSSIQSKSISNNDDDSSPSPQTIPKNDMDDESSLPRITSITGNVDVSNLTPTIPTLDCQSQDKSANVNLVGDDDAEKNIDDSCIIIDSDQKSSEECDSDNVDSPQNVISEPIAPSLEEIIKQKAEKFIEEERLSKIQIDKITKPHVAIKTETEVNIKEEPNIVSNTLLNVPIDLDYINEGIEFVDDGIAFADDDDDVGEFACFPIKDEVEDSTKHNEYDIEADVSNKFDLKLLMQPIVYTTKLDDMKSTKLCGFDSVKDMSQIDDILIESKQKKNSVDVKEKTTDDTEVIDVVNDDESLGEVIEECRDDEPQINDPPKVKLSSQHLQKPKNRTYDPIKLCKNPDFNTRLKRLNMGFFGYTRNIQQLKACKPLTIDLQKTFEAKLVNGTLYLESDKISIKQEKQDQIVYEQTVSVVPSAIPVQSLLNNTITNIDDLIPKQNIEVDLECNEQKLPSIERSKVINLPDISEIRRINQRLQTAEVTPVQIGYQKETLSNQTHVASTSKVRKHVIPLIYDDKTVPYNVSYVDSVDFDRRKKMKTYTPNYLVKPTKHVPLSWISKTATVPRPQIDYLLAKDSLMKMLSLMSPDEQPVEIKKKKPNRVAKDVDEFFHLHPIAPKMANKDTNIDEKSSDLVPKAIESLSTSTNDKYKRASRKMFCCWAREKMEAALSKRRTSKHKCSSYCVCCCRFLLLDNLKAKQHSELQTKSTSNTIELSDNEEERSRFEKVNDTIESVVQEARKMVENQSSLDPELVSESGKNHCNEVSNIDPGTIETTQQNNDKLSESIQPEIKIAKIAEINDLTNEENGEASEPPLSDTVNVTKLGSSTAKDMTPLEKQRRVPRVNISIKSASNSAKYAKNVKKLFKMLPNPNTTPPPLHKFRIKQTNALVIDGTRRKPKIKAISSMETKKKVLYINSASIMKPQESPIFLGDNKILLTNITFPDGMDEPPKSQFESAITAPSGVNIILLPDGELTYNLNPGVTLSDKEIASMPELLIQIKSQLSAHGIKIRNKENKLNDITSPKNNRSEIDINLEELKNKNSELQNDTLHEEKFNSQETPTNEIVVSSLPEDENSKDPTQQINPLVNDTEDSECCESTQINTEGIETTVDKGQTGPIRTSQVDKPEEIESSSNSENVSRKSLLSDLMEMSGISAEDTLAAPAVSDTDVPASEDVIDLENGNYSSVVLNSVTSLGNQLINLSAVTSFKKLKYASEQGGKFFKMNTLSGQVTPINVCIKNNRLNTVRKDQVKETFIDLTDEVDSVETTNKSIIPENDVHIPNISSQVKSASKYVSPNPVTINPAVRPIRLIKSNLKTNNLKLNKHLEASQIASSAELLARATKKKEQTVISSNDNSVEEYLIDDFCNEESSESSESSDDEPLAKVAKRMKFSDDTQSITKNTDEPMETANETEEFLDEEMLDESDLQEYASPNNSEDDCILGV